MLQSIVAGTAGLTVAAAGAVVLALLRRPKYDSAAQQRQLSRFLFVGLGCQALHFSEEFATGFYTSFPVLMGLAPWSPFFFLVFNVCWLGVWAWAAFVLPSDRRTVFFAIWFFALAATANAIAHPILAFRARGYFAGLFTSPILGIVGVWLLVRLVRMTEPDETQLWLRRTVLFLETIAFTVLVPGAVVYWIPKDLLGLWDDVRPRSFGLVISALLPLTVGMAVYFRCLWEFAAKGRGIPAPLDHPKQLVVTGLYRYVRNPMYLGVLLVLLGEATLLQSAALLVYAIAWLFFVHFNVLLYEEPNLARKFGSSYADYKAAVHRWIPGKRYSGVGN